VGNYKSAGQSKLFPDVPLNPLGLFMVGEPIRGKSLANVAEIVEVICDEFKNWQSASGGNWPSYANGELSALVNACQNMKNNIPADTKHTVDSNKVRGLIKSYITRLRNDANASNDFMNQTWTLWNSMVDFGNTIACGGTIQTTMEFYA